MRFPWRSTLFAATLSTAWWAACGGGGGGGTIIHGNVSSITPGATPVPTSTPTAAPTSTPRPGPATPTPSPTPKVLPVGSIRGSRTFVAAVRLFVGGEASAASCASDRVIACTIVGTPTPTPTSASGVPQLFTPTPGPTATPIPTPILRCSGVDPATCGFDVSVRVANGDVVRLFFVEDFDRNGRKDDADHQAELDDLGRVCNGDVIDLKDVSIDFTAGRAHASSVVKEIDACPTPTPGGPTLTPTQTATPGTPTPTSTATSGTPGTPGATSTPAPTATPTPCASRGGTCSASLPCCAGSSCTGGICA